MADKLRNHKYIKLLVLVTGLIFPAVSILSLMGVGALNTMPAGNLYVLMSFGFYGSLAACLLFKKMVMKLMIMILNFVPGLFLVLGAVMGGVKAVSIALLTMLLPFVPWIEILA